MQSKSAIVSFSGGQDSTTCLFWALSQYDHLETVGFNYGQKNNIELVCRQNILGKIKTQFPQFAEKLGCDLVIDASTFGQVSASALAHELGGDALVDFIVRETHTCYEGDREHFHPWGYGCGKCPACVLREKGFEEYCRTK